jgi:hypothetical protein
MQERTILNNVSPDQLTQIILDGVQAQIEKLKATFQPKEPTIYLTRNEVKELLHIDLSTVHNWTKKRKLQAYGIGNRIYYKRHEIEQAIIPIQSL